MDKLVTVEDYALHYAGRAWPVLPISPATKITWLPDWVNKATTNPQVIRSWFVSRPNAGIGIRTGAGLVVADTDSAEGEANLLKVITPEEAATQTCNTPKGKHRYYHYPIH